MANIIVAGILTLWIGSVAVYLIRQKKKGRKCIGCPYAGQCGGHGGSGCHGGGEQAGKP